MQLKAGVNDTVANISAFSDKTLDENYGSAERNPSSGDGKKSSSASSSNAANIVQQSIIKRFNQHSIMVMKATANKAASEETSNGQSTSEKPQQPVVASGSKRLHEKIVYEDLEDADESAAAGASKTLKLDRTERYLSGPTSSSSSSLSSSTSSSAPLTYQEVPAARANMRQELKVWTHSKTRRGLELLPAGSAVSALIDLSPGGALMKAARAEAQLAGQCPDSVQADLRALYLSLAELLRHFWACFPPTTPQLQEKAAKMHETLRKFQQVT